MCDAQWYVMCDAQYASQNRNTLLLEMTFDAEIEKNVQRTGADIN